MTRTLAAIVLIFPAIGRAQEPPDLASADDLAQLLKPILIQKIPPVLFQDSHNWGHQAMIPVGVTWRGLKAEVRKSPRNHDEWRKLIVTAQDLPRTLDLKIHDVKTIDAEKQTFKVFLTFQMGVHYEQQNWANGVRLWSGSVRARAQVKVDLDCENTIRVVFDKGALPDFLVRVRATAAKVHYDKLVVEHINGIGGSGAKVIGDALHDTVKRVRPSLERELLAKASDAVVRSVDTREMRIGFSSLFKSK